MNRSRIAPHMIMCSSEEYCVKYIGLDGCRYTDVVRPRIAYFGATDDYPDPQWLLITAFRNSERTFAMKDIYDFQPVEVKNDDNEVHLTGSPIHAPAANSLAYRNSKTEARAEAPAGREREADGRPRAC